MDVEKLQAVMLNVQIIVGQTTCGRGQLSPPESGQTSALTFPELPTV
jgi:hypothetical protein